MKKFLSLTTSLLLSILSFASQTEYVNDKFCVYEINVGDQTAKVVNFYSTASSVTIPASFVYQGDRYVVTSIGVKDFKYSYDSKYCYEDYEKNRACIVELVLPKSIKYIEGTRHDMGAFSGMTRLKQITIPASVERFNAGWFGGNSRLESIIFEGLPCYEYYVVDRYWNSKKYQICLAESDNPSAIVDSMRMELQNYPCPRLQKIEVVPLKEYIQYKNKLERTYQVYSQQLKDTINKYTLTLMSHPYYVDDNYFKGITLKEPHLQAKGVKENYALLVSELKKDYNKQLALCKEKYSISMSDMENNCKRNNPELYAEKYCAFHPDFSEQIDLMLNDYKCKYSKTQLAKLVLLNYILGEKCQDELWKQYKHLYKSDEAFLTDYYKSSDIKQEISNRNNIYNGLKNAIQRNKLNLKGLYQSTEDSYPIRNFRGYYDQMKEKKIPVSNEIISLDPKAQKEYEKNGQYFESADDFFGAYITSNYSSILKANKKAKK